MLHIDNNPVHANIYILNNLHPLNFLYILYVHRIGLYFYPWNKYLMKIVNLFFLKLWTSSLAPNLPLQKDQNDYGLRTDKVLSEKLLLRLLGLQRHTIKDKRQSLSVFLFVCPIITQNRLTDLSKILIWEFGKTSQLYTL